MRYLWRAARRKEVTEDSVIARLRKLSFNREAAVRLFVRMNVLEFFEILTDDKQMKRHVVQDVELFDLCAGCRVKDRKTEFHLLSGARRRWVGLNLDDVIACFGRS